MKSAFELAMERLNKVSPSAKLTDAQKAQLAEIESVYRAKIAEEELRTQDEIAAAMQAGDAEKADQLRERLARERRRLEAERESKKDKVRAAAGQS